jgi:hypothetical protein
MLKKQIILMLVLIFTFSLAIAALAQEAAKPTEDRWEGTVTRHSSENSTLTVRKVGSGGAPEERIVQYDSSTRWVSQYHGDNKATKIDPSEVKDGDRVICTGTWGKNQALHATLISKRLSHSPSQ